jgi:predicted tellurium resistance membrane protein TerC
MFESLSHPEGWISLVSLMALEVVLGIDNIVFVSIVAGKLPLEQRQKARVLGLGMAVVTRLILLFSLSWIMSLKKPLFIFDPMNLALSGKDLLLLFGGLFLIAKSSHEIYHKVESADDDESHNSVVSAGSIFSIIGQIIIIDTVFSLDSIITAVGMVQHLEIMVLAVILSVLVMIVMANPIGSFIDKHPSIKVLALSFLIMIGTLLTAEAFHYEIPKGYVYFALAYALGIEMVNIRLRSKKSQ